MRKIVLIAGGSGLIGRSITQAVDRLNWEVRILTRGTSKNVGSIKYIQWDIESQNVDNKAFRDVNYIINLAGAPVADRPWTSKYRDELLHSRTASTSLIKKSLIEINHRPDHILCASAIGYYGDRSDEILDENATSGRGFISSLTQSWESSSSTLKNLTDYLSIIRIGLVLSDEGGFYTKMTKPIRLGIAPYFGDGLIWFSWIHILDLTDMILFCLDRQESGVFNAVSPNPLRAIDFMKELKIILNPRALVISTPPLIIKMLMPKRSEILLMGSRVQPKAALDAGFSFKFLKLEDAVRDLSS